MTTIYHFTHASNLSNIINDGGLLSESECARRRRASTRSGNAEIKDRRLRRSIDPGIGMAGVVGDYVPFYFAPRSPMLFSIKSGNVPGVDADQDQIVYLVASAQDFTAPGFVVTDGNAASGLSSFYGTHEAIRERLDWEVLGATYWRNTDDDGDRMRRRMAEFLVHRFVAWTCIRALATRVSSTRLQLLGLYRTLQPPHCPPIEVRPGWYYS